MKNASRQNPRLLIAGLFCIVIGAALLLLDIIIIAVTPGPEYILAYLTFERTASEELLSGRWIFTAYFSAGVGLILLLYDGIRRFIQRFR